MNLHMMRFMMANRASRPKRSPLASTNAESSTTAIKHSIAESIRQAQGGDARTMRSPSAP
jgi:hypothetical protein